MDFTPEEQRLLALMQELTSRREYQTGAERFPGTLTRADAATIAADVQASVDLAVEKRAEIVARTGSRIACGPGCNACCEQLVMIWAAEAELIAAWLQRPENAETRCAFLEAYPRWRDASEPAIAVILERTAARDARGQFAALVDHWRRRILCAFNRDGLCTIYPVRPVLCRNCHALDTADNCHPADGTGTAATSLQFAPLEEFLQKTRGLAMAMHNALGGKPRQSEALCTAVYERLVRDGALAVP